MKNTFTFLTLLLLTGLNPVSNALWSDLDHNFWGTDGVTPIDPANNASTGADPHHWNGSLGRQKNAFHITYDLTNTLNTLTSAITIGGVDCDGASVTTHQTKGMKTQSIQDTIVHDCNFSYNVGVSYFYSTPRHFNWGYDSLKSFVERCPTNVNAPSAFGAMSGAVQNGGHGQSPGCWIDFKSWLISALAWNPHDPTYFCADVETLVGALASERDTSWSQLNTATNKRLSIVLWLIHNPLCTNGSDSEEYTNSRGSQKETWFNTQDTTKVPFDTTIYSMHDLGLDSVLKYAALLGVNSNHTESIISNATASPNPLSDGTVVSFGMSREGYVKVEVFDLLGHPAAAGSFESVLVAGNFSVPISLHGLPSGTYYARILTTYGETATVKLVKE